MTIPSQAEENLMRIMNEVSFLGAHDESITTLALDDPEIFKYPVIYIIEVSWWTLSPRKEAVAFAQPVCARELTSSSSTTSN